jgi:GNAT superfamily N-acetyltransferase
MDMRIRAMSKPDIPAGLRLNQLAGWNQTAADWNRFLEASEGGCFVVEDHAVVCGTATTISYENRFAWIGMVLVDPRHQKRGIGTQLLNKTIEYLEQQDILTMKLDATPQGQPLYAKLGFVAEYEIARWILKRPTNPIASAADSSEMLLTDAQLEPIFKFDREVFGADRSFLLRSLRDSSPEFAIGAWSKTLPQGYAFGRQGYFADHLGPWVAKSPWAAQQLLEKFMQRSSRDTLIVDCLPANSMAIELLRAHAFVHSRQLTRMFRGPNAHPGNPESQCAIVGPEFG